MKRLSRWRIVGDLSFAALLLLCVASCRDDAAPAVSFSLEEESALQLPSGFSPVGAVVLDTSNVLLWSESGRVVTAGLHPPLITQNFQVEAIVVGAIRTPGNARIEYLNARDTTIVRADSSGRTIDKRRMDVAGVLVDAVHHKSGWFVLIRTADSALKVVRVASPDSAIQEVRDLGRLPNNAEVRLGRSNDGVTVTLGPPPARVYALGQRKPIVDASRDKDLHAALSAKPNAKWYALPPVDIDQGYVQVLADLRSDDRIIVRYGANGVVAKIATLRAPVGFVGSVPQSKVLFAIRAATTAELVLYSWAWKEASTNP